MPLLNALLTRLASLAATPAVVGVFITAGFLVVSRDWRLNLISLAAQYFFVAVLMTQVVRVELVAVKGLIGWLICLVFFLTEQQAQSLTRAAGEKSDLPLKHWMEGRVAGWKHQGVSARAAFAFMGAVMVALAAHAAASAIAVPHVTPEITLACFVLAGLGVLLLGLTEDPLRVGMGLLMFLSAFDLLYVALEPSLVVTGLMGSISFVIALGMAYLKTAQAAVGDEGGRA
ncbi:MAG: hypothetical protein ACOC7Y_00720 [Chloroflexota bacterium]